ncbi:hypothetical protein [Actinophytocola sp.]|uniref:hypothetical protein n=1 Tax=Actinophytocola sp. TaxID=1872138 RepID=UPI003D6C1A74
MLKPRAHTPWYDVLIALTSLVVAVVALYVSWYVPVTLDEDARDRERTRSCVDAVVDLRASMQRIQTGYAVDQDAHAERLADWDAGSNAIERVRITCRDLELPTAGRVNEKSGLWEQIHTSREAAAAQDPDLTPVGEVLRWTIASIEDLTG